MTAAAVITAAMLATGLPSERLAPRGCVESIPVIRVDLVTTPRTVRIPYGHKWLCEYGRRPPVKGRLVG